MDAGTVRGTFDLSTPAERKLRDLKKAGAETDAVMRKLGGTLDRIGGPEFERRMKSIQDAFGETRKAANDLAGDVKVSMGAMRQTIADESARARGDIGELRQDIRALGRETAKPNIDLRGVVKANAEVAALRRNLAGLSRERSTPRVAMGGGFSGATGGLVRGAGAGGGGGGISRAVGSGIGAINPRSLLIGGAAAFARPLLGGATALIGSAGGAALGASAVGISGLGVAGVGLAGVAAIAKPAVTGLKQAMKAQQAYTKAVAEFGRTSTQAKTAKRNMDFVFGQNPGTRRATNEIRAFTNEWKRDTAPGRTSLLNLVGNVTHSARRAAPNLAFNANRSAAAVNRSGSRFGNFLAGRQTQQTLSTLTTEFVRDLPYIERGLENVSLTLEHIAVAGTPFFHDAVVWGDKWTHTWASSTSNIYSTRREIGHLVTEFKDWRDLTGSTFHLLRDIFQMGAPSGDSMVVSLTHTLDRWDQWIHDNPQKVRQFFHDAERDVSSLAGALVQVVGALNTIAKLVEPLLYRFTQLAQVMGGAGLLLPTAGRLAIGSLFGGRGGKGGGAGGGFFGFGGGGGAGGGRAGGGITTSARARTNMRGGYLAPSFAGEAATSTMGSLSALSSGMLFLRPSSGRFGGGGRPGGIATPEAFSTTYGRVTGSRYGAPQSTLGERISGVSRARAGVSGAARAGARFVLPLLGIQALIGAATAPGGFDNRVGGGLSAATFGAIPGPAPAGTGASRASHFVGGLPAPNNVHGMRRNLKLIQHHISLLQGQLPNAVAGPLEQNLFGPHHPLRGPMVEEIKGLQTALHEGSRALRQYTTDLERQHHAAHVFSQQSRARTAASEIGGVFRTFNRKESVAGAFDSTTQQMLASFHGLGRSGSRILADNMLAWARDMEKQNPALKGKVDDLAKSIESRFSTMGKHIRVVNGQIYDGSRTQWKNIAQNIIDPMEIAAQKTSAAFTAIQNQALQALITMGFSAGDARKLVSGAESSAQGKANLATAGKLASSTNAGVRQAGLNVPTALSFGKQHARGGMIPGRGMSDTVPMAGGAMAAPGEYWIANRHTMDDLSRATRAMYGKTAGQMIGGETRRHGYNYAATGSANIRTSGRAALTSGMQGIIQRLDAMGFHHGSTTGGAHAANSFHYRGEAVDYGDANNDLRRLWRVLQPTRGRYAELFGPSYLTPTPTLMHFGQGFSDPGLQAQHQNHIHIAYAGGAGGARGLLGGGGGAMGMRRIHLNAPGSGLPGVPGAIANRASSIYATGLQRMLNRAMGSVGNLSGFSGGGAPTANMKLGQRMMNAAGWGGGEWPALRSLWTRESGWNSRAVNPSSGAYGIPQALGHGHPFALGDAASQIAWGLRYIKGRYGSPSGAWAHEQSSGWYTRGGHAKWGGWNARGTDTVTNGPTVFGAGEKGRERVKITPVGSSSADAKIAVHFHGNVIIRGDHDIDEVGRKVARKILDELGAAA